MIPIGYEARNFIKMYKAGIYVLLRFKDRFYITNGGNIVKEIASPKESFFHVSLSKDKKTLLVGQSNMMYLIKLNKKLELKLKLSLAP